MHQYFNSSINTYIETLSNAIHCSVYPISIKHCQMKFSMVATALYSCKSSLQGHHGILCNVYTTLCNS